MTAVFLLETVEAKRQRNGWHIQSPERLKKKKNTISQGFYIWQTVKKEGKMKVFAD